MFSTAIATSPSLIATLLGKPKALISIDVIKVGFVGLLASRTSILPF